MIPPSVSEAKSRHCYRAKHGWLFTSLHCPVSQEAWLLNDNSDVNSPPETYLNVSKLPEGLQSHCSQRRFGWSPCCLKSVALRWVFPVFWLVIRKVMIPAELAGWWVVHISCLCKHMWYKEVSYTGTNLCATPSAALRWSYNCSYKIAASLIMWNFLGFGWAYFMGVNPYYLGKIPRPKTDKFTSLERRN
jgi:hypothetical protein